MAYVRRFRRTRRRGTTVRRRTTRYSRRPYRRRRNPTRRTRVRIPNYIAPDYALVRFKNRETISLPPFALINGRLITLAQVYGNDIFSSFPLMASSRPTGFDQWMALYQNFIIHQSALKVTPIAFQTADGEFAPQLPFRLVILPSTQTFTPATMDATEQPYSRSRVYNGGLPVVDSSGLMIESPDAGSSIVPPVFNSMYTKKILGNKDLSDVDEVRGSISGRPLQLWVYNIYVELLVPATSAPAQDFQLIVDMQAYYKAQLVQRRAINDSEAD